MMIQSNRDEQESREPIEEQESNVADQQETHPDEFINNAEEQEYPNDTEFDT